MPTTDDANEMTIFNGRILSPEERVEFEGYPQLPAPYNCGSKASPDNLLNLFSYSLTKIRKREMFLLKPGLLVLKQLFKLHWWSQLIQFSISNNDEQDEDLEKESF